MIRYNVLTDSKLEKLVKMGIDARAELSKRKDIFVSRDGKKSVGKAYVYYNSSNYGYEHTIGIWPIYFYVLNADEEGLICLRFENNFAQYDGKIKFSESYFSIRKYDFSTFGDTDYKEITKEVFLNAWEKFIEQLGNDRTKKSKQKNTLEGDSGKM
jgi:hypothetical protein